MVLVLVLVLVLALAYALVLALVVFSVALFCFYRTLQVEQLCVCVRVCACLRACVRACVRGCECVCLCRVRLRCDWLHCTLQVEHPRVHQRCASLLRVVLLVTCPRPESNRHRYKHFPVPRCLVAHVAHHPVLGIVTFCYCPLDLAWRVIFCLFICYILHIQWDDISRGR